MQFKTVKDRIQVIAYRGYDKDKKRAITKTLGSMCRFTYKPSVGLIECMTVDENKELQSYIENARQSFNHKVSQSHIDLGDSRLKDMADSIGQDDCTLSDDKAAAIWAGIALVQKSLKKRGFKRPAVDSQSDAVPDSRQGSLPV